MKNNLLNDMKTAAELFRDIRKLRKSGQVVKVEVESTRQIPLLQLGCGLNTPKDGEFIERALFWRELLKPVMTFKDCHIAMIAIIHWYIHIKKKNSAPAAG